MYQSNYFVPKVSQTYSETIEAVGLAFMFDKLEFKPIIIDKGSYFEIELDRAIYEKEIEEAEFFHFYKYLKTAKTDGNYSQYFDYEEQKERNKRNGEKRKEAKKSKVKLEDSVFESVDNNYSIYSIIYIQQAISSYNSIFEIIEENFKENFSTLLKSILLKYSTFDDKQKEVDKLLGVKTKTFTAGQVVSPLLGKGLNKSKAMGIGGTNPKTDLISQMLRFSGLFYSSIFKFMGDDTKVYVLQPYKIEFRHLEKIQIDIQKKLFASEVIKLDIKSILLTVEALLEKDKNNIRKRINSPKDKISGLQTAFFQKLGQTRTVTNISFLELPHFIEVQNQEDADSWIRFLRKDLLNQVNKSENENEKYVDFIGFIDDKEHSIFSSFRAFLTESDFEELFDFSFLYFAYVMRELSKGKHPQFISEKNLKEVLLAKFSDILNNRGFQAVAKAIRNSTISLQYAKGKGKTPIYEIKYGVAQDLKRKSEDSEELVQYLTSFIANYNSETARKVETKRVNPEDKTQRAVIKSEDIEEFVKLLDNHNPKTVAGLLASYGISIPEKKETNSQENQEVKTDEKN
jgi:hypothetical protein